MDPTDLLKVAPELQKIVAIIVAGVPLSEIVKSIVLPSADVLGKRMANRVERCFEKSAKMIEDAGIAPQPVADKLVVEILRGASLEDNEDLHTMWASLLANAASLNYTQKVRPGFVAILKTMAPDEAALLLSVRKATDADNAFLQFQAATKAELDRKIAAHNAAFLTSVRMDFKATDGEEKSISEARFDTSIQLLQHAGLIEFTGASVSLTILGHSFLEACRPPKAEE